MARQPGDPEHKDHIPQHTGSGSCLCSCGWVSGHYPHDDDLWNAFDAHVEEATK